MELTSVEELKPEGADEARRADGKAASEQSMMDPEKDKKPFDERAALEELERFQNEIVHYRQRRQAVHREFEQFVTSLPSPESVFPTERPADSAEKSPRADRRAPRAASIPTPAPTHAAIPASTAPSPSPRARAPKPVAPTVAAPRAPEPAAPHAAKPVPERSPAKRSRLPLLVIAVLLAAAGGLWIWNARRAGPQPTEVASTPTVQDPAATPVPPGAGTAAAPPPAGTVPAAPVTTESVVTTVRPVWVRVIADGERVVERELAADARVPFNAEKSIVIRTGDAGAVRLMIRGEDQGALGRDGQVVTRTFEVPVKPPR